MPSHKHSETTNYAGQGLKTLVGSDGTGSHITNGALINNVTNLFTIRTDSLPKIETLVTGGDKSHNNLPPYKVVYIFVRVG